MSTSVKAYSRLDIKAEDGALGWNAIQTGAILRIADACELMAKRYQALIDERDQYQRAYREQLSRLNKAERRVRSLKGVITRMRAKQ